MENAIVINDDIQKSKIDIKLVVSAIVFSMMVFARDMGFISLGPLYFIIVVSLISIILPYNSIKPFFYFYITVGIAVHGIALIPMLLALIIKNKKSNFFQLIFPIVILLFEIIHLAGYSSGVDINRFIIYSLYISLFFFLLFDDKDDHNTAKKNIRWYILGVVVSSFNILYHSIISFGFSDVALGNFRMGSSFEDYDAETQMITAMNPNQLALYAMTAFALLLFVNNIFKNRFTKLLILSFLIIVGILTGSRTWLIISAIILMLYFVLGDKKRKISFVFFVGLLLLFALKYGDFSDVVYGRYENRFQESSVGTAGYRMEIMKGYNNWLKENPERIIYGAGALYYNQVANIPYSTHNSTQQIIVCYGLIGILIFLFCIIVFHRRYPGRFKVKFWYFIPVIACFLFSQSGQFLSPACMMFPFTAAAMSLKLETIDKK